MKAGNNLHNEGRTGEEGWSLKVFICGSARLGLRAALVN